MDKEYTIDLVIKINAGLDVPKKKSYDQIVDYLNSLTTKEDIQNEREVIAKVDVCMRLNSIEEKWNYAEHRLEGNIIDKEYKNFCWLDLKQYTPRLVLNYSTGELFLEYVLEKFFLPRFKINKQNLLNLLSDWESYITSR